jgi:lauroyl/myristoyl acyltransferase
VSWVFIALLACAVALLLAAEWPRLGGRLGTDARRRRDRERRKANLRLLRPERSESEEFAASVERDLSRLPTIDDERR